MKVYDGPGRACKVHMIERDNARNVGGGGGTLGPPSLSLTPEIPSGLSTGIFSIEIKQISSVSLILATIYHYYHQERRNFSSDLKPD